MDDVPDLPVLGGFSIDLLLLLLALGFLHFLPLCQVSLRHVEVGRPQVFILISFIIRIAGTCLVLMSCQKVTQHLLVEIVIVIDLSVVLLDHCLCILAHHSVGVSFLLRLIDQFSTAVLIIYKLIDLLENCRVKSRPLAFEWLAQLSALVPSIHCRFNERHLLIKVTFERLPDLLARCCSVSSVVKSDRSLGKLKHMFLANLQTFQMGL